MALAMKSTAQQAASAVVVVDRPEPLVQAELAFRRHHEFIWRCVRRMGLPPDRAEDAVQDVFVVVSQRIGDFEGRSSLRTWLFAIAYRVVQEHRRKLARESRRPEPLSQPRVVLPDEELANIEAMRLLDELLGTLDDGKRAVFVLHDIEQLEAAEIAEALGLKVNTVYSRLRLARCKIERGLKRHRARDERKRPWAR
jgi:RNA polymerase sigma-70 factor (ECF subfamily)